MWLKGALIAVVLLAVALAGAVAYGAARWRAGSRTLHAKLDAARAPTVRTVYDPAELDGLPPPVRRFFQTVLQPGQPVIASARVAHRGQFSLDGRRWVPFTSEQIVITRRPGFDWDARVRMAPGVHVHVHDAYVAGEGMLHAALFGLVTVADVRGTPEAAQGELMRFLAEAAWYPTALLPSQGVRWTPVDDRSARASLTDEDTTVSLEFRFDGQGLIDTVRADARYRTVNGEQVPTPWHGRLWAYERRDGLLVPTDGEVAWLLPDGPAPYWRGHITRIAYELAR